MSSIEERLASLEARVDAMTELRTLIADMRSDMNRQFGEIRGDITALRGDMYRQVTELRGDMNRRIDTLHARHDRHFTWLVGLQMALMVAVVGALIGAYYR
jgi:hypothetical protein